MGMTEREKVMSWLEGLKDEDWRRYHSDSEVQTIAKEAFALLKEQEPVEPRRDANCIRMFRCGACGGYVGSDANEQDNYCPHCGRPVKWQ